MSRAKKQKADGPSMDDELPIWEFIYDVVFNTELHENVTEQLFKQYLDENPSIPWSARQLLKYYNDVMYETLYKTDLQAEKMLSLYKKLEIPVSKHVEMVLESRFAAILRVDKNEHLRNFQLFTRFAPSNTRSEGTSSQSLTVAPVSRRKESADVFKDTVIDRKPQQDDTLLGSKVSASTEATIWHHINRNSAKLTGSLLLSFEFWAKMIESYPDMEIKSGRLLLQHFNEFMLGNLWKQPLPADFKYRVLKTLSVPINEAKKNWILEHENVDVRVNDEGVIQSWRNLDIYMDRSAEDGLRSLPPSRLPEPNRKISTWEPRASTNRGRHYSSESGRQTPGPPIRTRRASGLPTSPNSPDRRDSSPDDLKPSQALLRRAGSSSVSHAEASKRKEFTVDDQVAAWRYIYKEIKAANSQNLEVLPKGLTFWKRYVMLTKSDRKASNWSSHFRKRMCPLLHEMPLKRDVLLYLYQNIDIEIDDRVLVALKRKCHADIRLDSSLHLESWQYLDQPDPKEEEIEENDSDNEEREAPEDSDGPGSYDTTLPCNTDEAMTDDEEHVFVEKVTQRGEESFSKTYREPGFEKIKKTGVLEQLRKTPRNLNSDQPSQKGTVTLNSHESSEENEQKKKMSPKNTLKRVSSASLLRRSPQEATSSIRIQRDSSEDEALKQFLVRREGRLEAMKDATERSSFSFEPPISYEIVDPESRDPFELTQPNSSSSGVPEKNVTVSDKWFDLNIFNAESLSKKEFLASVKTTMDSVNDDSIDYINEAAEKAFRKEYFDERQTMEGEAFTLAKSILNKSRLPHNLKRDLQMHYVQDLIEIIIGNVENQHIYEIRMKQFNEVIQKKVDELANKLFAAE